MSGTITMDDLIKNAGKIKKLFKETDKIEGIKSPYVEKDDEEFLGIDKEQKSQPIKIILYDNLSLSYEIIEKISEVIRIAEGVKTHNYFDKATCSDDVNKDKDVLVSIENFSWVQQHLLNDINEKVTFLKNHLYSSING